jgi:transcriptional regulator with XRE-family HTH domain
MTKIEKILKDKDLSQSGLIRLIKEKAGFQIGRDRISKICRGITINYSVETAVLLSEALDVKVDDIIEIKKVRKTNNK